MLMLVWLVLVLLVVGVGCGGVACAGLGRDVGDSVWWGCWVLVFVRGVGVGCWCSGVGGWWQC